MIAKLTGKLDSSGDGWAVVDVGGVGYQVFCSGRTLAQLPGPGEPVSLLIDTVVREDHIHLYGFEGEGERAWFRLLQTVQGVGARVALGLLTVLAADELVQAIAAGDRPPLTRASGVGPKLADRILAELKDKVPVGAALVPAAMGAGAGVAAGVPAADAISALVNLGYRQSEAHGAVVAAAQGLGAEAPVAALIRAGLRELAQ